MSGGLANGTGLSQSPSLTNDTTGLWGGHSGLINGDGGPVGGALLLEDGFFLLQENGNYILLE